MSEPTDLGDQIAASVPPLLDRLYAEAAALPPERRHEFAVNVLLNATLSVLEAVRKEAPNQHRTYLDLAVLALNDD
jgi:hypothetical protein